MSPDALEQLIKSLLARYGPIIGVEEAAAIARRSIQTIYDWSSRGKLDAFRGPHAGRIELELDGFVRFRYGGSPDRDGRRRSKSA